MAFVDVLGFREIVSQPDTRKVSVYYSVIDESITELRKALSEYGSIDAHVMSDSIVFAVTPASSTRDSKITSLRAICGGVSHLQFYLALSGIGSRGGLSYGPISFHENRFVVGPALVKAVELEEVARLPRVAVDPNIHQDLDTDLGGLMTIVEGAPRSIYEGSTWIFSEKVSCSDGTQQDLGFLNFGIHIANEFKYAEQAAERIALHLKAGLNGNPKHLEKYQWLHKYFLGLPLRATARKYFLEI